MKQQNLTEWRECDVSQRNLAEPRLSRLPGWKGISRGSGLFLQLVSAFPSFHHLIRVHKTLILHRRAPPHFHQASRWWFFFSLSAEGGHSKLHTFTLAVVSDIGKDLNEDSPQDIGSLAQKAQVDMKLWRGFTSDENNMTPPLGNCCHTVCQTGLQENWSSQHLLKRLSVKSSTLLCWWRRSHWPRKEQFHMHGRRKWHHIWHRSLCIFSLHFPASTRLTVC